MKLVKNVEVPPPSFTICRKDYSALKDEVLYKYGLYIGKHLKLDGYRHVEETTNKTMSDILQEAAFTQNEIVMLVSVIDEKIYMAFDKHGSSFEIKDDDEDVEVKPFIHSMIE